MRFILTTLFTFLFVSNSYAIECTLQLCKKFQKRSIEMNKRFERYFKAGQSKRYNNIRKIAFSRQRARVNRSRVERKELLWPIGRGRISSKFGYRNSPFDGHRQHHNGIDIAAPLGTRIRASASGVVTKSGWIKNGCGYGVFIKHYNYETVYCHASKVFVKKGEEVKRGQHIAAVGSTGRSTGPHLHFEIRSLKTSKSFNPLEYLPRIG